MVARFSARSVDLLTSAVWRMDTFPCSWEVVAAFCPEPPGRKVRHILVVVRPLRGELRTGSPLPAVGPSSALFAAHRTLSPCHVDANLFQSLEVALWESRIQALSQGVLHFRKGRTRLGVWVSAVHPARETNSFVKNELKLKTEN